MFGRVRIDGIKCTLKEENSNEVVLLVQKLLHFLVILAKVFFTKTFNIFFLDFGLSKVFFTLKKSYFEFAKVFLQNFEYFWIHESYWP